MEKPWQDDDKIGRRRAKLSLGRMVEVSEGHIEGP